MRRKILGITIDNKLTFKSHLKKICKKANQKFNALARITKFTSPCQKLNALARITKFTSPFQKLNVLARITKFTSPFQRETLLNSFA